MKEKYLLLSIILSVFLILFFTTSFALIPGDFGSTNNGPSDGVVDFEDLMIFALAYGSTSSDPNWNPVCDIAGPDGKLTPDGIIDFEDLMVFAMHYGECDEDTLSPITLSDSITFAGKTFINGGEHTITVEFAVPVVSVRVFITNYSVEEGNIRNLWGIPSNAVKVFMSTADGKTYTGTADFGWGNCVEEWIYVLSGDSCCPVVCSRTVIVDNDLPYVGLKATMAVCDTGDCAPDDEGHKFTISTVLNPDLCDPLSCCGDGCNKVAYWEIAILEMSADPYDDCCVLDIGAVDSCDRYAWVYGYSCDISVWYDVCIADADIVQKDYKVVVYLEDLVGNTKIYNGILSIDTPGNVVTVAINDVDEDWVTTDCPDWDDTTSGGVLGEEGEDCNW